MLGTRSSATLCTLLAMGALGCADATDGKPASDATQRLSQVGPDAPVVVDATRTSLDTEDAEGARDLGASNDGDGAAVERTDDGLVVTIPGAPPFTVDRDTSGPRVISVDRTDRSADDAPPPVGPGPRILDVTRTDVSDLESAPQGDRSRAPKVNVERVDGTTRILVDGFPPITLTPVGNGEIEVSMPGTPSFRIPDTAVFEGPGGLRIVP